MRNALALMVLAAVGLVGSGCVVVDAVKEGIVAPPSAEVVDVVVVGQTAAGVAVEAVVELSNPNAVQLPVEGVDVSFSLADGGSFVAASPPTVVLPPEGTQRMRVRAALPTRGEPAGQTYDVSVTTRWVPPGEVRAILTDSGVPLPFVVARGQGVLGESPTGG